MLYAFQRQGHGGGDRGRVGGQAAGGAEQGDQMGTDHAIDRVLEAEAQLFAKIFPQRRAFIGDVVDAALISLERQAAAAAFHAAAWRPAIGRSAGVVGVGIVDIERRRGLGRQDIGAGGVGGVRGRDAGDRLLVERGALGVRHVGAFVAFEQRVPLQLLLDEGRGLDVGKLKKLDRLPQLRRHYQGLALTKVKTGGNRHDPDYREAPAQVNWNYSIRMQKAC